MATQAPDFTYLTPAEQTAMRATLLAEINRRAGIGSISSGASQGQAITMTKLSEDALAAWWRAINTAMGTEPIMQVQPAFTGRLRT
jgi:hypothetical protein